MKVALKEGSPEFVDVLESVKYTITGSVGGGKTVTFEVTINVGPPPSVKSDIPAGAPGANVLDLFKDAGAPTASE